MPSEEAFSDELDINPERRDDWTEVNRYVAGMNCTLERLTKLPLSNRLIKDTPKILLSHARGRAKNPGNFRTSYNWIGGADIRTATFIPRPRVNRHKSRLPPEIWCRPECNYRKIIGLRARKSL